MEPTLVSTIASFLRKPSRMAVASACHDFADILDDAFNYHNCYVCFSRLHFRSFPMKQRALYLFLGQNLDLKKRRCYPCGSAAEAENINRRRLRFPNDRCICCLEYLSTYPPPYNYLRNSRSRQSRKRCGRCLRDIAPFYSIQLQQVCRSWKSLAFAPPWISQKTNYEAGKVLYLVIQTIACSTVYRVPWSDRTGLKRIALFLSPPFITKFPTVFHPWGSHRPGIGILLSNYCSHEFSIPARPLKWKVDRSNAVIERACCSPQWRGYFCYVCKQQH